MRLETFDANLNTPEHVQNIFKIYVHEATYDFALDPTKEYENANFVVSETKYMVWQHLLEFGGSGDEIVKS